MRTIDGEEFLSPQEAASLLAISYKTLQRWSDAGGRWVWVRPHTNGNGNGNHVPRPQKVWRSVEIDFTFSRAGHRLYRRKDVERLVKELEREEKQHRGVSKAAA